VVSKTNHLAIIEFSVRVETNHNVSRTDDQLYFSFAW